MRGILFWVCVLAVTVYLAVAAWEDYKTCEVTRWKHLIGGIPAIFLLCTRYHLYSWHENALILVYAMLFILAGRIGVYGMADGYVFMILTLFCGSIGGRAGIGAVILIMTVAGGSFLINHLAGCVAKKEKLFCNMASAFIPHILIGYVAIWIGVFEYVA